MLDDRYFQTDEVGEGPKTVPESSGGGETDHSAARL